MRKNVPRTRRSHALLVLAAAAIGALIWVVGAFADAGNPIVGTIKGNLVSTPMPGFPDAVTVYVRGQWNWLTHNSDCNVDRAGAGAAFVWNDPNEPGYTVTKGSISVGVGVKQKLNGDTLNFIDGTAHPADNGNKPENLFGPGTFTDSTSGSDQPAGAAHPYTTWKGGCGRTPLSITNGDPSTLTFPRSEASNSQCADGSNDCAGHPWGSWGYQKGSTTDPNTTGYSHIYTQRSDVTSVCVDFYDVHGKNQIVNGTKEIDVLGNGDNSVQTNAFDPTQGANCVFFPLVTTNSATTCQTSCLPNADVNDTANVTGAPKLVSGTISFAVYGSLADCNSQTSGTAEGSTTVTTSATGTASATSSNLTKPVTPGDYYWRAKFSTAGAADTLSDCNDTTEHSHVAKNTPTPASGQKVHITDVVDLQGFVSGGGTCSPGNPAVAGSAACADFILYDSLADCTGAPNHSASDPGVIATKFGVAPNSSGIASTGDLNIPFSNTNTDYYWFIRYNGDSINNAVTEACVQHFALTNGPPQLPAGVDP